MEIRCMICKKVEQISSLDLEEVGKFVDENNLRGVDFLNYLSLTSGYTCTNDKKHKYEFTEEFDKQIHEIAKTLNEKEEEIFKLNREITELDRKMEETKQKLAETHDKRQIDLKNIRELAYIDNPKLWL